MRNSRLCTEEKKDSSSLEELQRLLDCERTFFRTRPCELATYRPQEDELKDRLRPGTLVSPETIHLWHSLNYMGNQEWRDLLEPIRETLKDITYKRYEKYPIDEF